MCAPVLFALGACSGVFPVLPASPQEPPRETVRVRESVTLDLSKGATFTFDIGPNLPPFTFKLIPQEREDDSFGNARSTIRDVEVYEGASSTPWQHLTGCDTSEMEPPPRRETDWFRAEDLNFDGYQDLFLLTMWGATGNQGG